MVSWQSVVDLARELDDEYATGTHDDVKSERLARLVLTFQQQISPGVHPPSEPPTRGTPGSRSSR